MKVLKIMIGVIIAIIAIIAIVVTIFFSQINAIVKEVIEVAGSDALQTTVTVDKVDIQLKEGKGTISGIGVDNPPGFSGTDMLRIGNVGVHLDISALEGEVIVLKEVFMNGMTFVAEHKNLQDTNVQAMIQNLNAGRPASPAEPSSSSSTSSSRDDLRLMVESLQVGATEVTLQSEKYGSKSFTIPSYTQTNIGDRQRGLSPKALSKAILSSILLRVKKAVSDRIKDGAKDRAKEKAKEKLEEKLGDKLKGKVDTEKLKSLFQ